ncbi:hypothetical protein MKW98_009312, partial [Papaver atlanticum]
SERDIRANLNSRDQKFVQDMWIYPILVVQAIQNCGNMRWLLGINCCGGIDGRVRVRIRTLAMSVTCRPLEKYRKREPNEF